MISPNPGIASANSSSGAIASTFLSTALITLLIGLSSGFTVGSCVGCAPEPSPSGSLIAFSLSCNSAWSLLCFCNRLLLGSDVFVSVCCN